MSQGQIVRARSTEPFKKGITVTLTGRGNWCVNHKKCGLVYKEDWILQELFILTRVVDD